MQAISEFPKGRKYLISLSFRGKASVRPAQVGGFDVNIVIHGSTAVRGRGDLVAYRWALWKLTAPWTHRTRPPHLGKRCAFSTSSTGPFPSNHSRKTPKGPKIALGNPDRPRLHPPQHLRAGRPGRLHHASPGWLPIPGCGIATCPTWAVDTAGLAPAGLQPCRLLPAASGSSTDGFATRHRVPAGPGSQAMATAIPKACLASSAIRCRDVETGPNLGVLAVFPSTGATCRCPLPSTGSRGLNSPASAVL